MSDPRVVGLVNERFVPVWVNLRTSAVPIDPALDPQILGEVRLDANRNLVDDINKGFFLRSVVLTPDAAKLLNPQDPKARLGHLSEQGFFPYAQVKAHDYLTMLNDALRRFEQLKPRQTALGGVQSR